MSLSITQNSFSSFVLAARPKTLGAIICPVLLGSSLAFVYGPFSWSIFFLCFLTSILLQILANWVNDYGDFIRGADSFRLGPKRAMQIGAISLKAMKMAIGFLVVLISLFGLILINVGGWPIFFVGVLALFMSLWYTMGKTPLAYLGFSEIVVFLLFGPFATLGAFYIQTSYFSWQALGVSLSPGFLSACLLLTNNLRDHLQDEKNNKRTLAVRFGASFAKVGIVIWLLCSFFGPVSLILSESFNWLVFLGVMPIFIPLSKIHILKEPISSKYNLLLQSIGQALYLLGFVLALGIIYGYRNF